MAFTNQYLIDFFKQRMVELFDVNTLDSYSVRTCNTLSIFCELKDVLEGWVACNVKRGDTVAKCIEECGALIDVDEWLDYSFFDKDIMKASLIDYAKKVKIIKDSREKKEIENNEAKYIHHLVTSCITVNDTTYLNELISSIRADLFTEKLYEENEFQTVIHRLDSKLSFMATELLRRGYSKSYLYFFFKSIKVNKAGIPFEEAFDQLKIKFGTVHKFEDNVIIRLNFPNHTVPEMENLFDEVPAEYFSVMNESIRGFFKKTPNRRFYIVKENAADTGAALQKARLRLSQALDRNNMGEMHISNMAVVSYVKDGSCTLLTEKYYELDGGSKTESRLPIIMRKIDKAKVISNDIKDRLNTALRHLRVGDEQAEIEQRFLNYWIGLEFIFSTPKSGDSTFARMIEKFPAMKTLYYLKRNINNLDLRLREKGLLGKDKSFGGLAEEEMDAAYNNTDDVLLKYRIKRMKSHLHDPEKVKAYLDTHAKNLEWHLSRIYHLRNELVHEAAIKHNIEGVSSNLRSYLVFMLNLLLDYCSMLLRQSPKDPMTMDNFFWHYEMLWKKCVPKYDKVDFLKLDIPEFYVR